MIVEIKTPRFMVLKLMAMKKIKRQKHCIIKIEVNSLNLKTSLNDIQNST